MNLVTRRKYLVANAPKLGLSVFLCLALRILTPVYGWADAEPRYVVFQFQGMESDAPTEPDLPGLVAELKERFGAQPAGTGRHVGFTPDGQEPVGRDTTQRPPREVKMRRDEMIRAGYHALFDRGFTREKVRRLAEDRGVSVSHVVSELRHAVAHDYAEFRAQVLAEAGLPRARIYTHFVSPMRPFIEKYRGSPMVDRFPRVKDSVNAHSRPGYTLVREFTDLPDLLTKIRDSRREAGGELDSAWAGVETYCTTGQPGRPQTQEEYEAYLGGLFAHDMRLINVYGWNLPPEGPSSPFSVKNAPGVVQAVANWVSGKELPSDWRGAPPSKDGPPQAARLGPKMQRLQQLLAKRRDAGDDISHIVEMMRPMRGLMREGKVEAAEQLIDRALRAAQQGGDSP